MENVFTIRHYVPEKDLHTLSHLLTEIESIDRDGEDTSEEYLRASLVWQNYRPAQDVWVADAEGKLIGYAVALEQASRFCTIYLVVHPSHRRKGLGSQFLQLTLNRARDFGSEHILVHANERNQASNLFLAHHQFQHVASSGTMKLNAVIEYLAVELPEGFTLKKYTEVNDPLLLLKALNECYLGMWGHWYREHHSEEERKSPTFLKYYDGNDIFMLFDKENSIAGFCSLKPQGKQESDGALSDLLDGPGVIQKHREQGYQRPLVLAGIQHLRKMGTHPIILEFWGEGDRALEIYRDLEFEMVNHYLTYHKELE